MTVDGSIAAETEYTLECRLWPLTSWDADPLADSAKWNASMCDTSINGIVATCACQGTGYVAIFEGENMRYSSTTITVINFTNSPTWHVSV